MKEFFKDSRNVIISGCIALAILIIVIIFLLIRFNSPKMKQQAIENDIKTMAADFYENYYYDLITKDFGADQLAKFKKSGIIVDLNILGRHKSENLEKIKEFKHPKKDVECDREKTKAIIYPKESYNKNDYEIKVELSCGFED